MKLLTENEIENLGLKKTLGLSPSTEPTIKRIHHKGEYLNLIYLPSIGWVEIPSYRSISTALKIGKNELNRLTKNKGNKMTETKNKEYIKALDTIDETLQTLDDMELLDALYRNMETDIEISEDIKDELKTLLISEADERYLFDTETFNMWIDYTSEPHNYEKIEEPFTENAKVEIKKIPLTQMVKNTLNEIFLETKKEILNTNISEYSKTQMLDLLKFKISDLSGIQIDEDYSYLETEDKETTITEEILSEEDEELKNLYVEALNNIQPYEKIDTSLPLNEIQNQIKNNSDILLNEKVKIYIKSKTTDKEIRQKLSGYTSKYNLPQNYSQIAISETTEYKTLNTDELFTIKNIIEEEFKNTFNNKVTLFNESYSTQNFDDVENIFEEGYIAFNEIFSYINQKIGLDLKENIVQKLNTDVSVIENLNIFDKFLVSKMISEKLNFTDDRLKKYLKNNFIVNKTNGGTLWYSPIKKSYMFNDTMVNWDDVLRLYSEWNSEDKAQKILGESSTKETKDFLNKLDGMDRQILKMKIFDRQRTNYDTDWQRRYFYGSKKQKSKDDMKWLNDLYQKYNFKGSEEDILKSFLKNPKEYFKGMK